MIDVLGWVTIGLFFLGVAVAVYRVHGMSAFVRLSKGIGQVALSLSAITAIALFFLWLNSR
jgi:hypothetical protein